MLFNTGTQQRKRNIDILQIRSTIGPGTCEALIDYLAFSGCDSTSAFVDHGNTKGYKLLHDHRPFRSTMAKLGKSLSPCKDACDLYTSSVPTIRQPFGGTAWRHDHQCHPLMAMDGLLTETFWYIGRTLLQLHRQYLNVQV